MMNIVHYCNPFDRFSLISDSIFDQVFKDFNPERSLGYPRYDQYEKESGEIILEISLAGYRSTDLSIEVEGNKLTIKAEHSQKRQDAKCTVSGRSCQSFEKHFTAGKTLDLENIKALFEDGLLTIIIPPKKVEKIPTKKIEIQTLKKEK